MLRAVTVGFDDFIAGGFKIINVYDARLKKLKIAL